MRKALNYILGGEEMAERIFQVEYCPGEEVVLHVRTPPKIRVLPAATANHIRAMERELLEAVRSFIDVGIESIERREKKEGKTKIDIQ